jgi:glutamyl-tRNA synthetase
MANKKIITRFAPSPTGMLHIGGARTALFNYLFARANGGEFLVRVEDTDKERSTDEAVNVIIEGLNWLGLSPDQEVVFQSKQVKRHQEIVNYLLKTGGAYKCYASKEELAELRENAINQNKRFKYDRRWRDKDESEAPKDVEPVIRIKAPLEGYTVFNDLVQGDIKIPNDDLDDFVIQRSDGTPTYMLAVVVDDHDMKISHVIRGDDHLANVAKQIVIFNALGWDVPKFAHIPLIYGEDGKKLSKRHGATSVTEFKNMEYLPVAMRNYLLRLGFSHGDDEIISDLQAIEWFNLESVGKSPARFDYKKLDSVNMHYFQQQSNAELLDKLIVLFNKSLSAIEKSRLDALMGELKARAHNLTELSISSKFIFEDFDYKNFLTDKSEEIIIANKEIIENLNKFLITINSFTHENLYNNVKDYAEKNTLKMKNVAAIIRVALTGSHISPSIFEIMEVLGKNEVIKRLEAINS